MSQRTHKALALFAALALILLGLATGAAPERAPPRTGPTDLGLYRYAAVEAAHPSTFYPRLIAEQRREGYELKPFLAVRPPALPFVLTPQTAVLADQGGAQTATVGSH